MEHNENRGKTLNSLECFTNSQAHGSNDRAFTVTSMQQHHQDLQDFNFFFNFNGLCIYFREFSILQLVIKQQPTLRSSSLEGYIEE